VKGTGGTCGGTFMLWTSLATNSRFLCTKIRFPWFRVHIVVLNDPGRLMSVHIMHTGLVSAWSGIMLLYELITLDPTDWLYNPIWRQTCYVMPFISRIGLVRSEYTWSLGIKMSMNPYWTYEMVLIAHIVLSGILVLAGFWHWAYWDLNVFSCVTSGVILDLRLAFMFSFNSLLWIWFSSCNWFKWTWYVDIRFICSLRFY